MAKRNSKRRPWTIAEVRELKSAARKKTPARKIARSLKRSEGATAKGIQLGLIPRLARLRSDANDGRSKPRLGKQLKPRQVRGFFVE